MPKSAEILPPVGPPGWTRSQEEQDAWVRTCWANWKWEGDPKPCDCGFFEPVGLVTCDERQRVQCRATAQIRLRQRIVEQRQRAQRAKRAFPGPPFDRPGAGHCRWCGKDIINPKTGQLHASRTWCADGECLHAYNLHTRRETQLPFLVDRDGMGCKVCGEVSGRWALIWRLDEDRLDEPRNAHWACEGATSWIMWSSDLVVDHVMALERVAHLSDDARRMFFGPANLQGLCVACHVVKTREDMRMIRAERAVRDERAPAAEIPPVAITR